MESDGNSLLPRQAGEIDLLDLLKAVYQTRKPWLGSVAVLSLGFVFVQAFNCYFAGPDEYLKTVQFVDAEKGAAFEVENITAPSILQAVYEVEELDALGFTLSELQQRLKVVPYTPFHDEILKQYDVRLADEKISKIEESAPIEEQRSMAIANALAGGAELSLDVRDLKISQTQAAAILSRVFLEWSAQVLNGQIKGIGLQLVSENVLDRALFENVDFVVLDDLFREKVQALAENIRLVESLPGAITVADPVSGWNLSDLRANLSDLQQYVIDDAMAPIRSLGLSRYPDLAGFYYNERLRTLSETQSMRMDQAEEIKMAYEAFLGRGLAIAGENRTLASAPGSEFLQKALASLSNGSAEEYLQKLNEERLKTSLQVAEMEQESRLITRILTTLENRKGRTGKVNFDQNYLNQVATKIPEILARLREYYLVNQRIYQQISQNFTGGTSAIYADWHQGVIASGGELKPRQIILSYLVLIFLVTCAVVPAVMIRNALMSSAIREKRI